MELRNLNNFIGHPQRLAVAFFPPFYRFQFLFRLLSSRCKWGRKWIVFFSYYFRMANCFRLSIRCVVKLRSKWLSEESESSLFRTKSVRHVQASEREKRRVNGTQRLPYCTAVLVLCCCFGWLTSFVSWPLVRLARLRRRDYFGDHWRS